MEVLQFTLKCCPLQCCVWVDLVENSPLCMNGQNFADSENRQMTLTYSYRLQEAYGAIFNPPLYVTPHLTFEQ